MSLKLIIILAGSLTLLATPAAAQATRTWVSGVGDDVNPCSRTAPCKTFAGAISKTAAGGEISVLDAGGYGAVTITKSISIVGQADEAGILASLTTGVVVNAGPNDIVLLRGLVIDGGTTGLNGVRFTAGAALLIEDSLIRNFRGAGANGVLFAPTGTSELTILNTTISDNIAAGVSVQPGPAGRASVTLKAAHLINNEVGLNINGAGTQVWIGASTIAGSTTAVQSGTGAVVRSFGDNHFAANGSDGSAMTAAARK